MKWKSIRVYVRIRALCIDLSPHVRISMLCVIRDRNENRFSRAIQCLWSAPLVSFDRTFCLACLWICYVYSSLHHNLPIVLLNPMDHFDCVYYDIQCFRILCVFFNKTKKTSLVNIIRTKMMRKFNKHLPWRHGIALNKNWLKLFRMPNHPETHRHTHKTLLLFDVNLTSFDLNHQFLWAIFTFIAAFRIEAQ